jgi:hypothetical protein
MYDFVRITAARSTSHPIFGYVYVLTRIWSDPARHRSSPDPRKKEVATQEVHVPSSASHAPANTLPFGLGIIMSVHLKERSIRAETRREVKGAEQRCGLMSSVSVHLNLPGIKTAGQVFSARDIYITLAFHVPISRTCVDEVKDL